MSAQRWTASTVRPSDFGGFVAYGDYLELQQALALARQEAEANRREPKWWTDAIPTPELRCLIKNGANVAQQRYRVMSLAGLVSHMFGVGHTHATEICQRAGLDPYRDARKGALDAAKAGEKG